MQMTQLKATEKTKMLRSFSNTHSFRALSNYCFGHLSQQPGEELSGKGELGLQDPGRMVHSEFEV